MELNYVEPVLCGRWDHNVHCSIKIPGVFASFNVSKIEANNYFRTVMSSIVYKSRTKSGKKQTRAEKLWSSHQVKKEQVTDLQGKYGQ